MKEIISALRKITLVMFFFKSKYRYSIHPFPATLQKKMSDPNSSPVETVGNELWCGASVGKEMWTL